MNNYIKSGQRMTFTAPAGGVVSGTAYLIGTLLVVAASSVAQGLPFEGAAEGVYTLPKAASQAWTEGALVYWNNTAKNLTTTATGNTLVGCAAAAAGNADTTGLARLTGAPAAPSA